MANHADPSEFFDKAKQPGREKEYERFKETRSNLVKELKQAGDGDSMKKLLVDRIRDLSDEELFNFGFIIAEGSREFSKKAIADIIVSTLAMVQAVREEQNA